MYCIATLNMIYTNQVEEKDTIATEQENNSKLIFV